MTAVFAFAFDRKVVVATDTLRVDPAGLFPNRTVAKSYCWKNLIAFGAAGTGAFIQNVASHMAVSESDFAPEESEFLRSFEICRKRVLAEIFASADPKKKAAAHGTILAAIPTLSSPGHILRIDFATGNVTTCIDTFAADGSSPEEFTDIAREILSESEGMEFSAQYLAMNCISRAISICPNHVGWPLDLRVAESNPDGSSQAFELRIDPRMPDDFLILNT